MSIGGAASGAATGAAVGSAIPVVGTGIGALAGGLYGLFKGGKKKDPSDTGDALSVKSLSTQALGQSNSLGATGKDLLAGGQDAIHSTLSRLMRLIGGDRTAALEAAGPEVNTVSDQYDAAFKNANTGIARGGGRNATLAGLPQAKDAAIQTALQTARNDAGGKVADIGTSLASLGVSAQNASSASLAQLIQGAREGHAESIKALEDLGLGLGQIIAMIASGKSKS